MEHPEHSRAGSRVFLKPLLVFAVIALGLVVIYVSPLREYLRQVREIKARVGEMGMWGPVIYMLAVSVVIALGFPRLFLCPVGGIVFGFFWGLVWTQIPTLLGYYTTFLFVRWGGREFVVKHWPGLRRFDGLFKERAVPALILVRQLPISGVVMNLLLGLSPVRHRDFLLGTAIGLLPQAIPFTLVASGTVKLTGGESALYIGAAAVIILAVWIGSVVMVRRSTTLAPIEEQLLEGHFEEDRD